MKHKQRNKVVAIPATGNMLSKWKQLLVMRKLLVKAICKYVSELILSRAVDRANTVWYTDRLATAANLMSLLLARDRLRFLRSLMTEDEEIRRSPDSGAFVNNVLVQWKSVANVAARLKDSQRLQGGTHENTTNSL